MCDSIAEGGTRCAAHTRPGFEAVVEQIEATNRHQRSRVRVGRAANGETFMQQVSAYASTPSGHTDVVRYIDKMKAEVGIPDRATIQWLEGAVREGERQRERSKEVKAAFKAEQVRLRRAETKSASPLRPSRGVDESNSLAGVYPQIAAQWSEKDNVTPEGEPVGPDQVRAYANARVTFVCDKNPKHRWTTRLNNRTNKARAGEDPGCPYCNGSAARQRSLEKQQETLAGLIRDMDGDPEAWQSLPPSLRYEILARGGMLSGNEFERSVGLSLARGDLTLADIAAAQSITDLGGKVDEHIESDEAEMHRIVSSYDTSETESSAPSRPERMEDRVDQIMVASGAAAFAGGDEEMTEDIVRESVENLWGEVYADESKMDAVLARAEAKAEGNEYRSAVARRFRQEVEAIQEQGVPEGYQETRALPDGTTEEQPLMLSQRRFAMMAGQRRRFFNFSGTGAGKTRAAALAVAADGAQETLVVAPKSVVGHWKAEFEASFPGHEVRIGLPRDGEDLDATSTGRPRVWVVNYDKFSDTGGRGLDKNLGALTGRLDAVVLDEIHKIKDKDDTTTSKRRKTLERMIDSAGESNNNLMVIGQSATPVVTSLDEGKSLLRIVNGENPTGYPSAPTIKNMATAHKFIARSGVRHRPAYQATLQRTEKRVDITRSVPRILADVERMRRQSNGSGVHPAMMEKALLPYKLDAISESVNNADGPVVIYSQFRDGMVDPIADRLRGEGHTVAQFTGSESSAERTAIIKQFQEGKIKALVGTEPIATGVDGLQHASHKMIVASAAWTAAADDQLVGRMHRTGQKKNVEVEYIKTEVKLPHANPDGSDYTWSYCDGRYNRIQFRRSMGDAVVDGVISDGAEFESADKATASGLEALRRIAESQAPQRAA